MSLAIKLAAFDHLIRGPLSQILPHDEFIGIYSRSRSWFLDMLSTTNPKAELPSYPTEMNGLIFRNDLGNAAGMDKDGNLLAFNYLIGAGFAVVGTALIKENKGNIISYLGKEANPWTPLPYSDGAINSLGLPHKGIEETVYNIKKFKDKYCPQDFPIGISIMEHPKQEGEEQLRGLYACLEKALEVADFIEVNDSCPNVAHAENMKQKRNKIETIVSIRNNKSRKHVPIYVKLGALEHIPSIVEFYDESKVNGLVIGNTWKNYPEIREEIHKKDKKLFDDYTKNHKGGVSGAPIEKYAYRDVKGAAAEIVKQKAHLNIIHVGGIGDHESMKSSRAINPEVVRLREWYTRFFSKLATEPIETIYKNMILGGSNGS